MNKTIQVIIGVVVIMLLAWLLFFKGNNSSTVKTPVTSTSTGSTYQTPQATATTAVYTNSKYGFSITLPKTWDGYTVIEDQWSGDSLDVQGKVTLGTVKGPMLSIRHPDWDYKSPRQDIPVMVFTIKQWNDMQADKFHIGAAPINPSELGRNKTYVFGLPARYNYAFLTGYEEVDQILRGDNFRAF